MVTVQEIMTDPIFKGFRIVAGRRGLYNEVSGTGIFDWEEPQDIAETFARGEFVITTLSEAKNRPEALITRVKALIENHASAICIKTLFFKSVPQEIIELADKSSIPIILFENTYVDDIIYAVRNALSGNGVRNASAEQIEELLWEEEVSPENAEKAFRKISPFLYENHICIYATPRYQKDRRNNSLIEEENEKIDRYIQEKGADIEKEFNVAINMTSFLVIVCSLKSENKNDDIEAAAEKIIDDIELGRKLCVGISNPHNRRSEFATALKESMYANISATVDREKTLEYRELGTDALLIPICNHMWRRKSYEADIEKLKEYDEKHNAKLLDTMLTYGESEGSVALTAIKMLQHENTIRHRLERIRGIIGTDEQEDTYVHMYLLARLYKISQVMIS